MLSSRACRTCGEEHLVQSNGLMSIHTTARGERCVEEPHKLPATLSTAALRDRAKGERIAARNASRRETRKRTAAVDPIRDPEFEAAFDLASEKHRRRVNGEKQPGGPMDRRIYAVPGAISITSGGLPGTARSH